MVVRRPRLRFGIKTAQQFVSYEEVLRVWQEADAQPAFEHAWLFDHFIPLGPEEQSQGPMLEGWTLLTALATQTQRLRLGLMVAGNTYRHPALLAKMGATLDLISRGRLDFGLGAAWFEREHRAYGLPFYSTGERIRRLGEACEVIKRLWTEPRVTFEGNYYRLYEAPCEPKPLQRPHPPFVIGGSGERLTLRVVARYASIWNYNGSDVDEFRRKQAVLDAHCAAIGRNPQEIERSIQLPLEQGRPLEALRSALQTFVEAGATHLILNLRAPYAPDIVARLAEEVVLPLQAAAEAARQKEQQAGPQ
ncbi:LLM class F420-dependent oxidoreductase [Thermogemmatispora sp.]|uniref:LLM class F420-dependent oxidoreductase n=1 Tax=Thermogemmatispora sp. TaxID=1968838 RepID=UPI0035E43B99